MFRRCLFLVLLCLPLTIAAQILTPVHWSGVRLSDDEVELTARMDSSWHLTLISVGDSMVGEDYYGTYTFTVRPDDTIRYVTCNDLQCLSPEVYVWSSTSADTPVVPASSTDSHSLLTIFLLGLLGGLLAIFTPCVWPVIPMTVSFFLHRDNGVHGKRDALLYGTATVLIYVGLGLLITTIFGASALNQLSTSAALNLFFFLLLVVFALSFFGLFEIQLPASWATAIDLRSRKMTGDGMRFGSLFLMAFTLVIVSFSCTGPIIGTLLVEAASMNLLAPIVGMFGFALALALPFSLLALFPDALQRLPKSGEWMNSLKVTLAFIELALSLKFLSVADTAYGWGILPRWLFFVLWVLCFAGLGIYHIAGIIHICRSASRSAARLVIKAILSLASIGFALYLLPAVWGGSDAKAVAAFAPPMEIPYKQVFHDYNEGLTYARQQNKPVLLYFTGYGCVNCRKMEQYVMSDPAVQQALQDFVLIELYVDSRRDENANGIQDGEEFSRLQRELFGSNAQPLYFRLSPDGTVQGKPMAFTTSPDYFLKWANTITSR